jgi:hypothetical protein
MVTDMLRECWQAERFDEFTKLYAQDALLDIYVPGDRMQFHGVNAIVDFWWQDFGRPRDFRFLHWVQHLTPWGAVIETSVIDEPTGEYYRWVNVVFVVEHQIVQHVVYCTGAWTTAAAQHFEPDHDALDRAALSSGALTSAG